MSRFIQIKISIINWFLKDKRLLIIGFILAGSSTAMGILNNFEWFHSKFDNFYFWRNYNKGVASIILQMSNNPQVKDIEGIQNIVTENGVVTHYAKPRIFYLMDTDPGFKEMKSLLLSNLLIKPTYEINAIINEQVQHRGKNPNNPYLAQRIISFVPVPYGGIRYKEITAQAYTERDEVTTESFLVEWIKKYKRNTLFNFCLLFFAIGFLFQMVYHLKKQ